MPKRLALQTSAMARLLEVEPLRSPAESRQGLFEPPCARRTPAFPLHAARAGRRFQGARYDVGMPIGEPHTFNTPQASARHRAHALDPRP